MKQKSTVILTFEYFYKFYHAANRPEGINTSGLEKGKQHFFVWRKRKYNEQQTEKSVNIVKCD